MAIGIVAIVAGAMGLPLIGGMFQPLSRKVGQIANTLIPNEILSPDQLAALRRTNQIEDDFYREQLRKNGFNGQHADLLQKQTNRFLNGMDYLRLYHRGELLEDDYLTSMNMIGFGENEAKMFIKVAEPIPTVGDIIQFSVREVYSPQIAAENMQYEGGDEVFNVAKGDIEAQGLSRENFMKYWAAHWQLPGISQGYEMLQRDLITHDQLDRLFVALDIMPGYVAPLKGISYHPFTRVDVRRMHKMGVLSEQEVFIAYAHNGFNPNIEGHLHKNSIEAYECPLCRVESNVGKMLQFTLEYNFDPPETEMTETEKQAKNNKDLTKTDILKGVRYRILNNEVATSGLKNAGYSEAEAEYLVALELYKIEENKFDGNIEAIRKSYVKGVLDKNETLAMLGPMNISGDLQEELFDQWDIEKIPKLQQPSRADILKFLKKSVIDLETATEELEKLGYSQKYIGWYLSDSQPSEE